MTQKNISFLVASNKRKTIKICIIRKYQKRFAFIMNKLTPSYNARILFIPLLKGNDE
jgi:hypothetical protein